MRVGIVPLWAAFGPTTKALTIGEGLATHGHSLAWLMSGSQAVLMDGNTPGSLTLAKPSQAPRVRRWLRESRPDVVVSLAGHVAVEEAAGLGIKTVVVSSVPWQVTPRHRPKFWAACQKARIVCIQRFGDWTPPPELSNVRMVEAIIDMRGEARNETGLLLHLGGILNQGKLSDKTGRWLVTIGQELESMTESIVIAGEGEALRNIVAPFARSKRVGQMSRTDFLNTLAGAQAMITTPGLTAVIEGYAYKVPVCIIPSAIPTHEANIERLGEYGLLAQPPFRNLGEALGWAMNASEGAMRTVVMRQTEIMTRWGTSGARQVIDAVEEAAR